MAMAVVNIAEVSDEINAPRLSEGNEFNDVSSALTSTGDTRNPSTPGKAIVQLQSENTQNDFLSNLETAECSQEKKKNNLSFEAPKTGAKKKYKTVLDSDSEEEDDFISSLLKKNDAEESSCPVQSEIEKSDLARPGKRSNRLIDSESEEEQSTMAVNNENDDDDDEDNDSLKVDESSIKRASVQTVKSRFRTIVDSESEDDIEPQQNSQNSLEDKSEKPKPDKGATVKVNKKQKKGKISSLIDTDSEDDSKSNDNEQTPRNVQHKSGNLPNTTEKSAKKRTGSIRASKDEAMRQIHSETQRLIRSTEVSLPYHRPKQRSLQEFLDRKQFIPILPEGLTTAAKVKMSSKIVSKVLEEKEKEAELFYKSSDSEDEEVVSSEPGNPTNESEELSSCGIVDKFNIEDTQKTHKNDVQNAHNKKEIIQQGAVDLGVPRKLFTKQTDDSMNSEPAETEDNNEENSNSEDPRKKTKEAKHGLREASVPRKLFAEDYVEAAASSNSRDELAEASQSSVIVESNSETADSSRPESAAHSLVESNGDCVKTNLQNSSSELRDAMACATIDKENTDLSNIFTTPCISNKELAKINQKGKTSRQGADSDETLDKVSDSGEPELPIGHVFGLPPPDFGTDDNLDAKKLSNIKKKLQSSVVPKIRGAPGTFIDLSDDVKPNKEGVQSLVERFIRHSATNKIVEVSSPVTVVHTEKTADGLKVIEQVLPYKTAVTDNFNDKELSKPGAKYIRLKNELIEKMAKKRGDEWKLKKQQEKSEELENGDEVEKDISDYEAEEEPLDDELQFNSESEPEEDDMPSKKEKKRKHHGFTDEEAEVSGEEDDDDDDDDEEMEIDGNADNEEEENSEDNGRKVVDEDEDTCDILSSAEDDAGNQRKKPSRIVKAFEDDSNSLPENSLPSEMVSRDKVFERTKTDVDMFASQDGNEGWLSETDVEIPPSQIPPRDQNDARSQLCKTPQTAVDILRFVSPITQLTAFNSPQNGSASMNTSVSIRKIAESSKPKTPLTMESPISFGSEGRNNGFQKKLFEEPAATLNDQDLMDLCSGKFTGIEDDHDETEQRSKDSGLSSTLALGRKSFEKSAASVADETSQDIRLTLDDNSQDSYDINQKSTTESKAPWSAFKVVSLSEDENSHENQSEANGRKKKLKKRKVKKLELSDDEDDRVLTSEDEGECEVVNNDNEDKYIDYDSEENEVVIVPKKDMKKVAAGFLDEEAELSESEWGSADEDEKDMDKLEFEEGDNEEIDENQMRDQLGKIHMRQVLDDDQRDVRMLQELLFDDGDLHTEGSGRERQFKWKNIDNLGDDVNLGPSNEDLDENGDAIEEDDLEWRKQRLEREKFIEEKMQGSTDIANGNLEGDSQIFKLGMRALNKNKGSSQKEPEPVFTKKPVVPINVLDLVGCPTAGHGSRILNKAVKRGSFLARGDQRLAQLAVQIKHSETTVRPRINPGNFVFSHISPSVAGTTDKEHADVISTNTNSPAGTMAKKRKPPAGVTPRTAKKAKIEVTRSTGKKLF